MKGDFTRNTFRKDRHYRKVNMQQGRVQVDADWNEQNDIQFHYEKQYLKDLIGKNGTLAKNNGFKITASDSGGFTIGPGNYYVDGILCENEKSTKFDDQPDVREPANISGLDPSTYIAYLDVWERHITHLDDPYIREQALRNVDTATRTKIVWQVKLKPVGSGNWCESWDKALLEDIDKFTTGTMKARAKPSPETTDKCSLYETAGYTRLENQLYRVEVHKSGDLDGAQFKWSRENGTVVSRITKLEPDNNRIVIERRGKDNNLDFKVGNWVEITDDVNELHSRPGTFVKLTKVEDTTIEYDSEHGDGVDTYSLSRNPKVRRWESIEDDNPVIDSTSADFDDYVELEEGVQIMLSDGYYRAGDYWLVPARTREGMVEWPTEEDDDSELLALPPAGITHHYAPLSLLEYGDDKFEEKEDLRSFFSSLTELVAMHYAGGDGQQALPNNKLPEPLRVAVTLGDSAINKTPLEKATVKFTIVSKQSSPGSLKSLPDGASSSESVDILTNDEGIAECEWTLGDGIKDQLVKAELYDACDKISGIPPIYFHASLPLSFYYIEGDGVEANENDPVKLGVGVRLGKKSVPAGSGYKVKFEVVSGGSLSQELVDLDSNGIATTDYLHSDEPRKQARAILLHDDENEVNLPPIYFNVSPLRSTIRDLTDFDKFIECKPDFIMTNGMAYNYLPSLGSTSKLPLNKDAEVFKVKPGELTRWYIVNAGPRKQVFFQFPNVPVSMQKRDYKIVSTLPSLSTSIVEVIFPQEGVYVEMDADLAHFLKGSGFAVLSTPDSVKDDHPKRSKIVELESVSGGDDTAHTKQLTLTAVRKKVQVVPDNPLRPGGLEYDAIVLVGSIPTRENLSRTMILNDSIPGPVVEVNQGDILEVKVVNETNQIISLLFAGLGPTGATGNIVPGESTTISFRCDKPGLFIYYGAGDGLNGIWEHVWDGMYGGIVVRPPRQAVAKEFCMVFSELYSSKIKGLFR